jgi:hypothetical protein
MKKNDFLQALKIGFETDGKILRKKIVKIRQVFYSLQLEFEFWVSDCLTKRQGKEGDKEEKKEEQLKKKNMIHFGEGHLVKYLSGQVFEQQLTMFRVD